MQSSRLTVANRLSAAADRDLSRPGGSYPTARDLWQLIADAYREDDAYGPEHPGTLAARTGLARRTGRADGAPALRE